MPKKATPEQPKTIKVTDPTEDKIKKLEKKIKALEKKYASQDEYVDEIAIRVIAMAKLTKLDRIVTVITTILMAALTIMLILRAIGWI